MNKSDVTQAEYKQSASRAENRESWVGALHNSPSFEEMSRKKKPNKNFKQILHFILKSLKNNFNLQLNR